MASRSKYVFVMFSEFSLWIQELVRDLSLAVILPGRPGASIEIWDGTDDGLAASRRVYLATSLPNTNVQLDDLKPGKLGWVQMDVPQTTAESLLVCQFAARTDWFDPEQARVLDNPEALKLYDKIWRKWKNHIYFPVWARNVKTGSAAPYPSIGYSSGAKEWYRSGGALRQEGLENIAFEIEV